jgi:hypothetical protein
VPPYLPILSLGAAAIDSGIGLALRSGLQMEERAMKQLFLISTVLLMSISPPALAQHEHAPDSARAVPTAGQKAFEALKGLAGSWEGTLTPVPPVKDFAGARVKVVIRVTSRGNALMHEMTIAGLPDDPITMLYLDGERLMMTHYCDAGNRPRMVGKLSPDGKSVAFEVLDISGSTQRGHMADAVFAVVDVDHHTEEWVSVMPGGKRMTGHYDLRRTKEASGPFGQ